MGDDPVAKALQDADVFYKENKFKEVYDTLKKLEGNTSHCELQWKLARAARDLAQLSATPKDQKKELIQSGLQFAENAVAANDKEFAAHKVSFSSFKCGTLSVESSSQIWRSFLQNAVCAIFKHAHFCRV